MNIKRQRDLLQKKAEQNLLSPTAYYQALKSTFPHLSEKEKQAEYRELTNQEEK